MSNIDWDALSETRLKVIGVNRSYMEYPSHDYLFVQDPIIVAELLDAGYSDQDIEDLNIHTTSYFARRMQIDKRKGRMNTKDFDLIRNFMKQEKIRVIRKHAFQAHAPFTIPHAISYFSHADNRVSRGVQTFYMAGLELTHKKNENHFWQNKYEDLSRLSGTGGSNKRQLLRQYSVFRRLKSYQKRHKYKIVSVTPKSKLNRLYSYETVTEVLNRYNERKENND